MAIGAKSRSFGRLAGDPARGVEGGKMAHSLRSLGSAALNYSMVAQGGLDLYWCVLPPFIWTIFEFSGIGKLDVGLGISALVLL